MLFDEGVVSRHGAKDRARGFHILMHSLFLSCAQDIAKLSMDADKRTPSIRNLVQALTKDGLRSEFRTRYSKWAISPIVGETDLEIIAALKKMQVKDQLERDQRFDELYCEMMDLWGQLSSSPTMNAFLTIRNKVSAHSEVQYSADKYTFVDISQLGLQWGDIKKAVETMQRLVELIGLMVRNAGFAWEMLDEQLSTASIQFWNG